MPTVDSTGKPAGYGNNGTEYGPVGFRPRPLGGSYITPRQPIDAAPSAAPSAVPSMAMNAVLDKFGGSMQAYNRWWHGLQDEKPRGWEDALAKLGDAPNSIQSPVSDSPGGPMGALQADDFPTPNPVSAIYINSPEAPEETPEPRPLAETTGAGPLNYQQPMPPGLGMGALQPMEPMPHGVPQHMQSPQMGGEPGGGMTMPSGASGYGTMSSQMGPPLPGVGPGGMTMEQGASGPGIAPTFNPMQASQVAGAMAPPAGYVAGQPFTQDMFPGEGAAMPGGGGGLVMPPGMGTGFGPLPPQMSGGSGFDGSWPQIPPDVPYVAGQQFNPGMFPGAPGFGPMDALQQKAIERSKRTQAFSNAARKLSR